MAGTLIAYPSPRFTTRAPNADEIAGAEASDPALVTGEWTEANYEAAAGKIFSQRSVDRHRGEFGIIFTPDQDDAPAEITHVFAFGEPTMQLSTCEVVGPEELSYTGTGSNLYLLGDHRETAHDVAGHTVIGKYGTGLCIEMFATDPRSRIILPIPPQSGATDKVAQRWQTFPRVSVRGDYLGADYRPISGRLSISIDNLTRDWIEEIWEPFREHCSKGGIFVYSAAAAAAAVLSSTVGNAVSIATEFAYCYAEGSVPAPVIRAGGYGSVSLNAGVARIP